MLDILRDHLNATETTEFIGMIEEAHDLFARFNLPDFDREFIEILMAIESSDSPSQEIYELTMTNQITILREHGIFINTESEALKVTFLSKILTAILLIEDSEAVDEIDSVIQNVIDPIECVAAILKVIDPSIEVEDVMVVIADIIHALPTRILERVQQNRTTRVATQEERITPEYQAFVRKAVEFLGLTHVYTNATMYTKILAFKEYLPIIEELIPEDPEKLVREAYAREILTAAIISNAGQGNYMAVIKKYLDEETDFPVQIHTQILVEIDSLNNQVANFKTQQTSTP